MVLIKSELVFLTRYKNVAMSCLSGK